MISVRSFHSGSRPEVCHNQGSYFSWDDCGLYFVKRGALVAGSARLGAKLPLVTEPTVLLFTQALPALFCRSRDSMFSSCCRRAACG